MFLLFFMDAFCYVFYFIKISALILIDILMQWFLTLLVLPFNHVFSILEVYNNFFSHTTNYTNIIIYCLLFVLCNYVLTVKNKFLLNKEKL